VSHSAGEIIMGHTPPRAVEKPLILVVGEHREIHRFIAETLGTDYVIHQGIHGEDGVERAAIFRADLLIIDITAPTPGGDDLVERVRRRPEFDRVPILVLTEPHDDPTRLRLMGRGAQDCLCLPLSAAELSARTRMLVTMKRVREILAGGSGRDTHDLETLARNVAGRAHDLQTVLDAAQVARERAEHSSQQKTHFVGMVSHELRTPLTAIQMQLRRLNGANANGLDDAQRAVVGRMQRSAGRLTELVESLLDHANLQSGCLSMRAVDLDLARMATEAVDDARDDADQKGLKLHLSIQTRLPPLHTDERVVRLVLSNLINNAVKFTERGSVEVSVSAGCAVHRLCVADTGAGIAKEEQARIFEPFQRLEPPTGTKHTPGVGLGLAMVRDMVSALGGQLALDSESGRGSTFTVDLPPLS
jgi:signal transduction histidine kinase